jgi:altronate hydrolase
VSTSSPRSGGSIQQLHPDDSVAIALKDLEAGASIGAGLTAHEPIAVAHKVAVVDLAEGAAVYKGGRVIGQTKRAISPGEWVHAHNLGAVELKAGNAQAKPGERDPVLPAGTEEASFDGFLREDGRVGTRNYIAVCIAGNCAATAAKRIAAAFTPQLLKDFPNVDGVVPLTHEFGCGMEMTGEPMDMLRRTLGASITHPNVAAAVVVALGCERNNIYGFLEQQGLKAGPRLKTVVLQEVGGTEAAIAQGVSAVKVMLPLANESRRERVPASRLVVGILSSGLDGHAALTSSVALAKANQKLVGLGGSLVTADTPMVLRFADEVLQRTPDGVVAERLQQRLAWWDAYRAGRDTRLSPNRMPQGKPVGISTMHEQSALALAAMDALPVTDVREYGQPITAPGWTIMDSPTYEAVAATGMVASGATLLCLATGNGSTFGAPLVPTVKLSTNSNTFLRWQGDLDLDAGPLWTGDVTGESLGDRILERWLAHASGEPTANEALGVGEEEFAPWPVGVLA